MRTNTIEDFWSRVDKNHPSGCWLWTGSKNRLGYGWIRMAGKILFAHRVAYETLIGPIPDGRILHHVCGNPTCVRAGDHVIPVTRRENTVELATKPVAAQHAATTHCKHGHPYDEENTRIEIPKSNPDLQWRRCRECERLRLNGWQRKRNRLAAQACELASKTERLLLT